MASARPGRRLVVALVLAVVVGAAGAGGADAEADPPVGPVAAVEQQPTVEQVAAGLARAARWRDQVASAASEVTQAQVAVRQAAGVSQAALESYEWAARRRDSTARDLFLAQRTLAQLGEVTARARAEWGRWARQAYMDGGVLSSSPGLYTLLSGGSSDEIATAGAWLGGVGRDRARAMGAVARAEAVERDAVAGAGRAADAAASALTDAGAARQARDGAVEALRSRLRELQDRLASTSASSVAADREAAGLAAAWAAGLDGARPDGARPDGAAGPRAASSRADGNRVTGAVGACAGGRTELYANGQIPVSALCPVPGVPGGLLRADAALAFDRLSSAFAVRFGRRICVTDTYRTFEQQVAVRARRPGFAAVPGTSNHGWGTAVDLCGGVQDYDSPEHGWLVENAPLWGWFLPAWADRDGSLPEPWHWEFGG